MRILVDADAFPGDIKDILFRAVERVGVKLIMVASRYIRIPASDLFSSIAVKDGHNAADDRIVEMVEVDDLVITSDIPLADRVISKGAYALNPRGELYSSINIKDKLAMRGLMDELRVSGEITGGPPSFDKKARSRFADSLDAFLAKHRKKNNLS
ncbi:MAG: hypothetical protein A2017_19260 [Lentisphaerae bacterium GWF2_44_16]|nr:MAG: hypothetical protein A2017_19260 [Lentisphaerae bacterium GWF2_44_16]